MLTTYYIVLDSIKKMSNPFWTCFFFVQKNTVVEHQSDYKSRKTVIFKFFFSWENQKKDRIHFPLPLYFFTDCKNSSFDHYTICKFKKNSITDQKGQKTRKITCDAANELKE